MLDMARTNERDRVIRKFGAVEGRAKMKSCQKPPRKQYGIPAKHNGLSWNAAAVSYFYCCRDLWCSMASCILGWIGFVLWSCTGCIVLKPSAGVCDEAVILYHDFSTDKNDLCSPPRTKPAPKCHQGESSTDWLAVRIMFSLHLVPCLWYISLAAAT